MTKTVPVNHVKGKAKPVNHVKSQAHMRGSGKRKFAPEPEINNGQCFYCAGEHNVNGVPHAKKDCPKRAHDLNVAGVYRRNIFSEPKPLPKKMRPQRQAPQQIPPTRTEIPVDAATLQRLGIGPAATVRKATVEDSPIASPDVDISDDDLGDFDELDATSISTTAAGIAELSMDMEQMDAGSG
ncbi:hypothetical protein P43SY_010717 [Pythium insidiosum]|uniref:Uncharacterized protein n=1 Tax=Pythium insidiosum TaxID=114742 RepID=A0AAD5LR07_PYTIN|nr:hypothetical protein P43SY_010717 [Pythium insidiosum]